MLCFLFLISLQIVLESLPVSSSGHVVLMESFLDCFFKNSCANLSSHKIILHFLHGSAVLVFAVFFLRQWLFLLKNFTRCWKIISKLVLFVVLADFITLMFFLVFTKNVFFIDLPLGVGFAITGFLLFLLQLYDTEQYQVFTITKVVIIGIVQGLALIPGFSRFATTFAIACLLKIKPQRAFEFSFAIQWPLITVSFLNSIIVIYANFLPSFKFVHSAPDFLMNSKQLLNFWVFFVIAISSIVSFFALIWIQRLINAKKIWKFAFYMIIPFLAWLFLHF